MPELCCFLFFILERTIVDQNIQKMAGYYNLGGNPAHLSASPVGRASHLVPDCCPEKSGHSGDVALLEPDAQGP